VKTFFDRLLEMPLDKLRELIDREQRQIWTKQRDLDMMNRALQQRTANTPHNKPNVSDDRQLPGQNATETKKDRSG
jgi:hypothetical protein